MIINATSSINAEKKRGIQCNNQHLIQVMPLNNHSIAHKKNTSCTSDIVAKDDDNTQLVGLVLGQGQNSQGFIQSIESGFDHNTHTLGLRVVRFLGLMESKGGRKS